MYCEKCGKQLKANDKFCIYCGAKVEEEIQEEIQEECVYCQNCGAVLNDDDRFCTSCGAKIGYQDEVISENFDDEVVSVSKGSTKKHGKKIFIAVLLILFIVVGVGCVIANFNNEGFMSIVESISEKLGTQEQAENETTKEQTENETTKEQTIIVGTGGTIGTYYALTNTICSFLNTDTYNFKVISTNGTVDNLEMISKGDIQLAIVQGDIMNYVYKGINGVSEALTGFSAIACVYPELCCIVATESSGIKTISDLRGKNIAIGAPGTDVFYNAIQILSSAGIDYNSDINATFSSFGDCSDLLKDGTIDAVFVTSSTNSILIEELAEMVNIVVVELDDSCISNLISQYSYYTRHTITESVYDFVENPVSTVAVMATYIVTDKMSEAQVYEITKNLWNNQEEISIAHAKGKEMNINNAIVVGDVPIHPGALKFYKEIGVDLEN